MSTETKMNSSSAAQSQFELEGFSSVDDDNQTKLMEAKNQRIPDHFSEYKEAKDRFSKFALKGSGNELPDHSNADGNFALDDIIAKFCSGSTCIEPGDNSTLFYDLIFRSDYLQIKSEIIEIFYSELCKKFIFSSLIDDIIRNLKKLESISHVKKYIVQAIFKELQIRPLFENDSSMILRYSEKKIWHDLDINSINSITVRPCAYKVMFSNNQFDLIHINFLLKLLGIKNVSLNGCNLNGRSTVKLFTGLSELTTLGLSKCGTSVNQIIENYSSKEFINLKNLDVSKNPLFDSTLERIRCIPLKSLNISNCIKTHGTFVNSIWFGGNYKCKGENAKGKIELLWSEGILRETIEVLNVSYNDISLENLQKILQLNLKELDITESLKYVRWFPESFVNNSITVLKSKGNNINCNKLKSFCRLPLKKLEIDYYGDIDDDFSDVRYFPLSCHLEELSIELCIHPNTRTSVPANIFSSFILFISTFHLKYYDCYNHIGYTMFPVTSYFSNSVDGGNHLETLIINGRGQTLCNTLVAGIKKLHLKELSIILYNDEHEVLSNLLSSDNLQESVVTLKLDYVQNAELLQVAKFKKLEKLQFCYGEDINEKCLKMVVDMTTLKELELKGMIIEELDLKLARLLCIAPVKTLSLSYDYNNSRSRTISDEAFDFLSKPENLLEFSKNLVTLSIMGTIKPNMARILKAGNWEMISIDHCKLEDNTMKLLFDNENLVYTLDSFTFGDVNIDWKCIGPLRLSELWAILGRNQFIDEIESIIHNQEPLVKFLRYVAFKTTNIKWTNFLQINASEVLNV